MGAYIYLRISKDFTCEKSAGLEAQERECKRWASLNNVIVCGVFTENAVSGTADLDERPKLMEVLNQMKENDILLVAKRDRLARNFYLMADICNLVKEKKARIISAAGEGTQGDSATDILMRRIADIFSEYECNIIQERTKSALAAKRARGESVGTLSYGFGVDENNKLYKIPEEQAVISLIKELRVKGKTLKKIALKLNSDGIPSRQGRPWNEYSVLRVSKDYDNTDAYEELKTG